MTIKRAKTGRTAAQAKRRFPSRRGASMGDTAVEGHTASKPVLMPHPICLHGHEFQVVELDGKRFPGAVRATVPVPPGRWVVIAFAANNPEWWAFHCRLLYHLDVANFTTFRYV